MNGKCINERMNVWINELWNKQINEIIKEGMNKWKEGWIK